MFSFDFLSIHIEKTIWLHSTELYGINNRFWNFFWFTRVSFFTNSQVYIFGLEKQADFPEQTKRRENHRIWQANFGYRWNMTAVFWPENFRIFPMIYGLFPPERMGNYRVKNFRWFQSNYSAKKSKLKSVKIFDYNRSSVDHHLILMLSQCKTFWLKSFILQKNWN